MAAAARSLSECAPAATFWLAAWAPVLATLPTPAAALLKPPPALAAPIWNADVALLTVAAIERAPLAAIRVAPGVIRAPAATAAPVPVAAAPMATAVPAAPAAAAARAPAPRCGPPELRPGALPGPTMPGAR